MGPTSKSSHVPDTQLIHQSEVLYVRHLTHVQINIHGNPDEILAYNLITLES